MQVIYIDILLLINFSMDFVALFLTARLMHARAKAIPLAAASLIGGGIRGAAAVHLMVAAALRYIRYRLRRTDVRYCAGSIGAAAHDTDLFVCEHNHRRNNDRAVFICGNG